MTRLAQPGHHEKARAENTPSAAPTKHRYRKSLRKLTKRCRRFAGVDRSVSEQAASDAAKPTARTLAGLAAGIVQWQVLQTNSDGVRQQLRHRLFAVAGHDAPFRAALRSQVI